MSVYTETENDVLALQRAGCRKAASPDLRGTGLVRDPPTRQEMMKDTGKKRNYFTVPVAIKKLEKREIVQQTDHQCRLHYAVTATQKDILKAFDLTATDIKEDAIAINDSLIQIAKRRAPNGTENDID